MRPGNLLSRGIVSRGRVVAVCTDHNPGRKGDAMNTTLEYQRLIKTLARITRELKIIGASDMGLIRKSDAKKFHAATMTLDRLTAELIRKG